MSEQATVNESKPAAVTPITLSVKVTLQALAIPEESGGYSIVVPALPGCHSAADDLAEAQAHTVEAAEAWLAAVHDRNAAQALRAASGAPAEGGNPAQAPDLSADDFEAQQAALLAPIAGEVAFYEQHLPEWSEHEGRYVLVKDGAAHGFYATREEAQDAGYERFGLVPFLVKRVLLNEQPRPLAWVIR